MDILDENQCCAFRLFREHCTFINGVYVKDLKRLNRDLKDIIIVDVSKYIYILKYVCIEFSSFVFVSP